MKRPLFPGFFSVRALALLLVLALLWPLSVPVSGFFWNKKSDGPKLKDFSKNGLIGSVIVFEPEDFVVQSGSQAVLDSITILSLPDPGSGVLTMGGQPLEEGATVERSALGGLRFQSAQAPTETTVSFTFSPIFSGSGSADQDPVTVTLYLLTQANRAPEARNMDLSTYKNVAITGYFDAADPEGDPLTFQISDSPARGGVTLAEDGSGRFVYTPYENKTGRDSFTYVALDQAGNASAPATVTLRIEKAGTKVRYADMDGDPAHKAALRLAETGVYVGQQVDSRYFFQPDATVSRAQFLTMAMAAVGLEPLDQVSLTGFADDQAIPTWAKGSVSAALKAGAIQGERDASGAPVFQAGAAVTMAEATVILDRLLDVADAPVETFSTDAPEHWAAQSAANLAACGVIPSVDTDPQALSAPLTRGEAAELLDGALDVLAEQDSGSWLPW